MAVDRGRRIPLKIFLVGRLAIIVAISIDVTGNAVRQERSKVDTLVGIDMCFRKSADLRMSDERNYDTFP